MGRGEVGSMTEGSFSPSVERTQLGAGAKASASPLPGSTDRLHPAPAGPRRTQRSRRAPEALGALACTTPLGTHRNSVGSSSLVVCRLL